MNNKNDVDINTLAKTLKYINMYEGMPPDVIPKTFGDYCALIHRTADLAYESWTWKEGKDRISEKLGLIIMQVLITANHFDCDVTKGIISETAKIFEIEGNEKGNAH